MLGLPEGLQGRCSGALRGRIGSGILRVFAFELFEFAQKGVVLGITYDRIVEEVVASVVFLYFASQRSDARGDVVFGHRLPTSTASAG